MSPGLGSWSCAYCSVIRVLRWVRCPPFGAAPPRQGPGRGQVAAPGGPAPAPVVVHAVPVVLVVVTAGVRAAAHEVRAARAVLTVRGPGHRSEPPGQIGDGGEAGTARSRPAAGRGIRRRAGGAPGAAASNCRRCRRSCRARPRSAGAAPAARSRPPCAPHRSTRPRRPPQPAGPSPRATRWASAARSTLRLPVTGSASRNSTDAGTTYPGSRAWRAVRSPPSSGAAPASGTTQATSRRSSARPPTTRATACATPGSAASCASTSSSSTR